MTSTFTRRAFLQGSALAVLPACQKKAARLPVLGRVPTFELTNQRGRRFGSAELGGTPYLAAFMFTRCPSICPRVSAKMRAIGESAERAGLTLHLVSFSVDGEYDTPEILTAYAKKHGLSSPPHVLLTGDSKAIARYSEENFKIAVQGSFQQGAEHLGITHGSHLVLVDGSGNIRGYYRTSDEGTERQVLSDIEGLE